MAQYKPGDVAKGFMFRGGDDTDPQNWVPVPGQASSEDIAVRNAAINDKVYRNRNFPQPPMAVDLPTMQQSMQQEVASRNPLERFNAGIGTGPMQLALGTKAAAGNPSPQDQQIMQMTRTLQRDPYGMAGNIASNTMLAAGPIKAAAGLPGAAGVAAPSAVAGGLSAIQNPENRLTAGLLGAGGQAAGQLIGSTLAGPFRPAAGSSAEDMMKLGIPLTPGQVVGGAMKKLEEGAKTVGIPTGLRQTEAMDAWNKQVIKGLTGPTGQPINASGAQGIAEAKQAFSKAYDTLDKAGIGPGYDAAATTAAINQIAIASKGSIGTAVGPLNRETTKLTTMLRQPGLTLGSLREAASNLREIANKDSTGPGLRKAYKAMAEQLDAVRSASGASNPVLDKAYAAFNTVMEAAANKTNPGMFTPEQLMAAAVSRGTTAQVAQGNALMMPEAARAREVLGAGIPNIGPGTAERLLASAAITGGIPAALQHPETAAMALGGLMGARALYSPLGVRLMTGNTGLQTNWLKPFSEAGLPGALGYGATNAGQGLLNQ